MSSRLLPESITTPEAAAAIILKGRELNIGPMEALSGINVIRGKPSVSPQLMLALARRTKELEDFTIVDDGETCTVTVKRKGQTPVVTTFSMKDASKMGLASRDNWIKQPGVMRQWRAVAANLRVTFPDAVSGLYTYEEMGANVNEEGELEIRHENVVEGVVTEVSSLDSPHTQDTVNPEPEISMAPVTNSEIESEAFGVMRVIQGQINDYNQSPTERQLAGMRGLLANWLGVLAIKPAASTASTKDNEEQLRHMFLRTVFGVESTKDLSPRQVGGLLKWLALDHKKDGNKTVYTATETTDACAVAIETILRYFTELAAVGKGR